MKSRKQLVALSALAFACAPVATSAATVLFSDDFNAGTSGSRYDQFIFDRGNGNDAAANFNFNYGNFTYWRVAPDESTQNLGQPIPLAPRSAVGSPAVGLRLDANDDGTAVAPNTAVINLYPKLTEYLGSALPSGDHRMTVDVWMNYNGRFEGGGGSTEHLSVGLMQQGGGIGGGTPVAPPGGPFTGAGWTVNGERGNAFDYRFWDANTRIGGANALGAEVGYVAVDGGTAQPGPADGRNTFYQEKFTFPTFETPGSIGKHWVTLEMKFEDGILYHYLQPAGSGNPPILISARTIETLNSGHAMLGYTDLNNGTAALETGNGSVAAHDANFVLYDNLVVETVDQVRQKWAVAGTANWSNAAAWQNGDIADGVTEVADFTTPLPAPQVVFVDSPRTIRSVTFDSASAGYTLSGTNPITLSSLTTGIRTTVKAATGSHTIAAPLRTERPLTFDIASGAHVKVDNLTTDILIPVGHRENPAVITKNGAGVAEVNRIVLADVDGVATTVPTLTVNAGTLRITPNGTASGVSVLPNIVLGASGKLDLTNNKLITPMAVGTFAAGAYNGVSGMVDSARGNAGTPLWDGPNGITTSDARAQGKNLVSIGVAKAGQIKGVTDSDTTTFAGQTVLGSDTIAMVTYGGDATLDGKINIDDYGRIDANVASSGTVFGWYNGDFNYDGAINIDDYGIIDGNIANQGTAFPTAAADGAAGGVSAVPEPASVSLIALGAMSLMRRRRAT